MKNKVMSYKEFMSVSDAVNKGGKADIKNKDAKTTSKVDQDMSSEAVKGKGTSLLDKHMKKHMATIKGKNIVGK